MVGIQAMIPIIERLGLTSEDMRKIVEEGLSFENPLGQERLNPMYEANLAERLQFDGDVPELRSGALPKGNRPAVPVETQSQNPALIGAELKQASQEVQDLLNLVDHNEDSTELSPMSDPQGYERGQFPTPRKAQELSILGMTQTEKKENAWGFISTTQGRNSACPIIENRLKELLEQKGYRVVIDSTDNMVHSWCVDISSGAKATYEVFDYIGSVCGVFKNKIQKTFREGDLSIKVISVNNIAQRNVGWSLFATGEYK